MASRASFNNIGSFLRTLPMTTPAWAALAGVTTKIAQWVICSSFRDSPRLTSLMGQIAQLPGGLALFNFVPSILVAFSTAIALGTIDKKISYTPMHEKVDEVIKSDSNPLEPARITEWDLSNSCQVFFSSNYPKNTPAAHNIFCDAFGFAENNQMRVVALADGCGWGVYSQRAARAMIDGFFENLNLSPTESGVMEAVQKACTQMENKHNSKSCDHYYGATTFLGGQIFSGKDGKRYFVGVNCGDCKLYHLHNDHWQEQTCLSRINAGDSGGKFCPNRTERDKTEYSLSFEVHAGDKLLFMTDGVHDNLKKTEEPDEAILKSLQKLPKDENLGSALMSHVLNYTKEHLAILEADGDMNDRKNVHVLGKPDHTTLMILTI